jgi:NADPH:quinone reductase-like Zn-dependent oxidoreductase
LRAVVITRNGPPEVLQVQERPEPQARDGQVLIDVKAAGINFADTMARVGLYPDAPKPPCVVGYEVAGTVAGTGERVMAGTLFNGYAERVAVDPANVVPLPEGLSFEQGAAIPVNYTTAWQGLLGYGPLGEGDRALIHAAAGGVGISATQVAKWRGAEVFGTASGSKHDAIRAQGVDHPIDYRTQDFESEVMRITAGEGVDVAMDAIGPSSFRKSYRVLRPGGRLIMYGASELATGETRDLRAVLKGLARMPTATMPWWKSMAIMNENKGVFGLNMLTWWDTEKSPERTFGPLREGLDKGKLEPVIAEAFPFDRAADAHRFIAERRNVGKVVLTP